MELNIEGLTQEQIDAVNKLVQSHEDRIRTDYSKKLKDVQTELDQYKPKQKSESELAIEQRIANLEAKVCSISFRPLESGIHSMIYSAHKVLISAEDQQSYLAQSA